MKSTTKLGWTATAALALILLTLPLAAAGAGSAQAGGNQIAGTWNIVGTPDAQSGVPPFVNLSVISKDGTIVNEDPDEGTSMGGWKVDGPGIYAITFYGFLPAAGLRHRVTAEVALGDGGATFSGPFRTDVYDLQNHLLFSFEGTVEASRLPTP